MDESSRARFFERPVSYPQASSFSKEEAKYLSSVIWLHRGYVQKKPAAASKAQPLTAHSWGSSRNDTGLWNFFSCLNWTSPSKSLTRYGWTFSAF